MKLKPDLVTENSSLETLLHIVISLTFNTRSFAVWPYQMTVEFRVMKTGIPDLYSNEDKCKIHDELNENLMW